MADFAFENGALVISDVDEVNEGDDEDDGVPDSITPSDQRQDKDEGFQDDDNDDDGVKSFYIKIYIPSLLPGHPIRHKINRTTNVKDVLSSLQQKHCKY